MYRWLGQAVTAGYLCVYAGCIAGYLCIKFVDCVDCASRSCCGSGYSGVFAVKCAGGCHPFFSATLQHISTNS